MPVQAAQWTEFLSCPICLNEFNAGGHKPISLGCSHTVCKTCLHKLHRKACPFDQTAISIDIELLPVNRALLLLVGAQVSKGFWDVAGGGNTGGKIKWGWQLGSLREEADVLG